MLVGLSMGCAMSHGVSDEPAGTVTIGADGWSEPLPFEVPAGSDAMTIVIEGADAAIFALGSLELGGVEQIEGLDMEGAAEMGGGVTGDAPNLQTVLPGNFVFQYPTLATQRLASGEASLRVRSNRPGTATVTLLFGSGRRRTLRVSFVSFGTPTVVVDDFLPEATAMLAAAGIELVVEEVIVAAMRAPIPFTSPLPAPRDASAGYLEAARSMLATDAFPVVLADFGGVGPEGASRGTPCSPVVGSHRRGVFVTRSPDPEASPEPERYVARIVVHELGHAMGVHHPTGIDVRGEDIEDALSDTRGFDDTVMGSMLLGAPLPPASVRISPQQAFSMTRSLILE